MSDEIELFRAAFTEVHQRLNAAGVPSAQGAICDDPACKSNLGHRVKSLVAERDQLLAERDAIALKLTREWQQVIAAIAGDVMECLETVKEVELNVPGHPFYHGKMSVLMHFRQMADADEQKYLAGASIVAENERLRAALSRIARGGPLCVGPWLNEIQMCDIAREALGKPPIIDQHEALLSLIRTEQQKAIADGTEYGRALAFRYGLLLEGKEHGEL